MAKPLVTITISVFLDDGKPTIRLADNPPDTGEPSNSHTEPEEKVKPGGGGGDGGGGGGGDGGGGGGGGPPNNQ